MNAESYRQAFSPKPELITMGLLHVPSGRLVASDPFFCGSAVSFNQKVTPGDYEVQLHIIGSKEWGQRVSLARVLLLPDTPVSSLVPAGLGQSEANVYCVDSGLGSFMDVEARDQFAGELADFYRTSSGGNYYTDVLKAESKQGAHTSQDFAEAAPWSLHAMPGSRCNVAIFSSGLGDGCFESFWAISPNEHITALVTDFGLL